MKMDFGKPAFNKINDPNLIKENKITPLQSEVQKLKVVSPLGFQMTIETSALFVNQQFKAKFNVSKARTDYPKEENRYAEVMFKCKRRILFRNDENLKLSMAEFVIVELENGIDIGTISSFGQCALQKKKLVLKNNEPELRILRHATSDDFEKFEKNLEDEAAAVVKSKELVEKYKLDMKVTDSEWQFDHGRLTIYFTAPTRIDFRDLVKELARVFHTRIELRQISSREEAKRIGGMGSCGRNLCCSAFACDFCHITLEHARTQQLSNNVAKLSGYCGRLKCCLLYEYDSYVEAFKKYPAMHSTIEMKEGSGRIVKADVFKDMVYVHVPSAGVYKTLTLMELEEYVRTGKVFAPVNDIRHGCHDNFDEDLEELRKLED